MWWFEKSDVGPESLGPASQYLGHNTEEEKSTEKKTSAFGGHYRGDVRQAHARRRYSHQCKKDHPSTHSEVPPGWDTSVAPVRYAPVQARV